MAPAVGPLSGVVRRVTLLLLVVLNLSACTSRDVAERSTSSTIAPRCTWTPTRSDLRHDASVDALVSAVTDESGHVPEAFDDTSVAVTPKDAVMAIADQALTWQCRLTGTIAFLRTDDSFSSNGGWVVVTVDGQVRRVIDVGSMRPQPTSSVSRPPREVGADAVPGPMSDLSEAGGMATHPARNLGQCPGSTLSRAMAWTKEALQIKYDPEPCGDDDEHYVRYSAFLRLAD